MYLAHRAKRVSDNEVIHNTLLELNQDPTDCAVYSSFNILATVFGAKTKTTVTSPEIVAITIFIDLKLNASKYVFFSMSHYVINELVKQEFFLKNWCQPKTTNC